MSLLLNRFQLSTSHYDHEKSPATYNRSSFFLSGCTARHVVVLPQEAKSLSDTQWRVSQEPSLPVEPPDMIEEKKDLNVVQ